MPNIASILLLVRRPRRMINDRPTRIAQLPFALDHDNAGTAEAKLELESAETDLRTLVAHEQIESQVCGDAIHMWLITNHKTLFGNDSCHRNSVSLEAAKQR
jgi:hypothetical protein